MRKLVLLVCALTCFAGFLTEAVTTSAEPAPTTGRTLTAELAEKRIPQWILSENYSDVAKTACFLLHRSSGKLQDYLLWLAVLRVAVTELNRSELRRITDDIAGSRLVKDVHPLVKHAREEFLLLQYARLEDDSAVRNILRANGTVQNWWVAPPFKPIDEPKKGELFPEKLERYPCGGKGEPVEIELRNGAFSPGSAVAAAQLKGRAYVLAGFTFDIETEVEGLTCLVKSSFPAHVYIDKIPLKGMENSYEILPPSLKLDGTGGIPVFIPTASFQIPKLSDGKHSVFVLLPAVTGGVFSLAFQREDDTSFEITPLPFSGKDINSIENITTNNDKLEIMRYNIYNGKYSLFYPQNEDTVTEASKHLTEEYVNNTAAILTADYLVKLGIRSGKLRRYAQNTAKSVVSPLVAGWLAAFGSTDSNDYDSKCLKRFPNSPGPLVRLLERTVGQPLQQAQRLAAFAKRRNGWTPLLLDRYCSLVARGADFEPVRGELPRWPFNPSIIQHLVQPSSLIDVTTRLKLLNLLVERTNKRYVNLIETVKTELKSNNATEALKVCSELCRRYPWIAESWALFGEIYLNTGNKELARRSLNTALHIEPDYPNLKMLLSSLKDGETPNKSASTTPAELQYLARKASSLPSPIGFIILSKSYELFLEANGGLKGTVTTCYLSTKDRRNVFLPSVLEEWGDYTLTCDTGAEVLRNGLTAEPLIVGEKGLVIRKLGNGDIVVITQIVRRNPWAMFAPSSFDFIPAVVLDMPVVQLRYRLEHEGTAVQSWCSNELTVTDEDGFLVFSNRLPLCYTKRPSPPLPSIGWTSLSASAFAGIVKANIAAKGELFSKADEFISSTKGGHQIFVDSFNSLRAKLNIRPCNAVQFFSPAQPRAVLSSGSATPFEFACLFVRIMEESGVSDGLSVLLSSDGNCLPWDIPSLEANFLCPSLVNDFVFVFRDGVNVSLARAGGPLPIAVNNPHFCRSSIALSVIPNAGTFTDIRGFESVDSAEYKMLISANEDGLLSCSADISLSGQPAESLQLLKEQRRNAGFRLILSSFLARWLGKVRNISRDTKTKQYAGSTLSFKVPHFYLYWNELPVEKRKFQLVPLPVDFASVIQKNGSFKPVWSGRLHFRFILMGRIDAKIPQHLENVELKGPYGELKTTVSRENGTMRLDVMLVIRDAIHADGLLDEYVKFAKMANKVMETTIQWKP